MQASPAEFRPLDYAAVVFDLDGVLTRTQELHARAWKRAFDEYLSVRTDHESNRCRPFEIDPEYYRYVDGKPRYEGAESFLQARGFSLPKGKAEDPPGRDTICGIGNRKNELFLRLLEEDGVRTYEGSLRFIKQLRKSGIPLAVVSSSKNCVAVLAAAGALELFDVKIDGLDASAQELRGKPAPDIFLAAARHLNVEPTKCGAVEDATAGVEAARNADYKFVIGVNRDAEEQARSLRKHGAHIVVSDLDELLEEEDLRPDDKAPMDSAGMRELEQALGEHEPALFLDYDGTLTPIVDRPEDAVLSEAMRATLSRVTRRFVTAIISGRDLQNLKEQARLEGVVYAGSHGFDIALPGGERKNPEEAETALPALDLAGEMLEQRLQEIEGALVERKRFAVTVHYRLVDADRRAEVEDAVDEAVAAHPELRKRGGKKIFELLPDIEWDKGEALRLLLDTLALGKASVPVYIGDDVTDEDAFAALEDEGISIAVGRGIDETSARFVLPDTDAVRRLLEWFCERSETAQ